MLEGFGKACIEIDFNQAKEGDLILFEFEGQPKHIAILTDYLDEEFGIIHSFVKAGGVVEHRLSEEWIRKIVGVYRLRRVR